MYFGALMCAIVLNISAFFVIYIYNCIMSLNPEYLLHCMSFRKHFCWNTHTACPFFNSFYIGLFIYHLYKCHIPLVCTGCNWSYVQTLILVNLRNTFYILTLFICKNWCMISVISLSSKSEALSFYCSTYVFYLCISNILLCFISFDLNKSFGNY